MSNFDKLHKKSVNAINAVLTLIDSLKETNKAIVTEKAANEAKIKELHSTQHSLDELKESNEKIIANFEGLLK